MPGVFPEAQVQKCVIYRIRNSFRYIAARDKKQFMSDLKPVYNAPTEDSALFNPDQPESKWGKKYPVVIKSWRNNRTSLSVFFQYPEDIRRIIYTTSAVESLHSQFRKIINAKTQFPDDEALTKIIYPAYKGFSKKWLPIRNWAYVISQFSVTFEDRISKYL
ncbi:MAG: transposase [Ignavibacteria bacterium]